MMTFQARKDNVAIRNLNKWCCVLTLVPWRTAGHCQLPRFRGRSCRVRICPDELPCKDEGYSQLLNRDAPLPYSIPRQGHSDIAGRQADGATRTVKKKKNMFPRQPSLGRTRLLQLLAAAPWLDPPRPTQAVGWCGLSVGLFSCRISPTSAMPACQGRACIRRDAFAIQNRGTTLLKWALPYPCAMVSFEGDTRRIEGPSGLRLVTRASAASCTPPLAPYVSSRRSRRCTVAEACWTP